MKVCIVGCGAVGSIFAAHLARSGEAEVWAYDVNRDHVRAMNEAGLKLSGAEDFTASLHATTDPAELPPCDFGLVATKAMHTAAAMQQVGGIFCEGSAVCSVQNGLGSEEIIAAHVRHVIRGTTFPAGHVAGPGHVVFDIKGDTWIGPFEPSGTPFPMVQRLAGLLTRAGMNTIALQDARGAQWTKLIFNAATNPVGALTGLHHAAATFFPPTAVLFEQLIAEGEAVAHAMGIVLDADPRKLVQKGARAPGRHRASMLQDVLAGRPTEVDFMSGAIVKCAEQAGVPVPLNRAMWALVKGLEQSWSEE
ncbi:MAG: 2-dehydropantoate 2-reductase [Acidobacteria bacterium]|nr:2-dehydropantoate 2-reductase [Acidobacteriota bacterium]